MAGEIERLQWVLELGLDDASFISALNKLKAEISDLTARGATPRSGTVLGAGTSTNPGLAIQAGQMQAVIDTLYTRAAPAAGVAISRSLVAELGKLANGGVIGAVGAALGTRSIGGVSSDKFTAASENASRALIEQTTALRALTGGKTAAGAAVVSAEKALAAATEEAAGAEVSATAQLVQAATRRVEIAKEQVAAAQANLAAEKLASERILEAANQTKAAADRRVLDANTAVKEQAVVAGEAKRAIEPAKAEVLIAQTGLQELPPDASARERRQLEDLVAERQAELEVATQNAKEEENILAAKRELAGVEKSRADVAALDLKEITAAQTSATKGTQGTFLEAQQSQKSAEAELNRAQTELSRQRVADTKQAREEERRQQQESKQQSVEDEEARKAAAAKFIKDTYTPVAEAAAAGQPPIKPPFGPPPGGGVPTGPIDPRGLGPDEARKALAAAEERAAQALNDQRAAVLDSLVYLRGLINSGQDLISAQAEAAATQRTVAALEKSQTEQLLAGDAVYIEATAQAAVARRASAIQIAERESKGAGLERIAPQIIGQDRFDALAGDEAAIRAETQAALIQKAAATKASARVAEVQAKTAENELLNTEENRALIAKETVSRNALNRALKAEVAAAERADFESRLASGDKSVSAGTLTQRIQAGIANRSGGNFRAPEEFGTLGQVLSGGALTTAKFAASGIAFYGAFSGLSKAIGDGEKFNNTLATMQTQLKVIGQGDQFDKLRSAIIDISAQTGQSAADLAGVAQRFVGLFGDVDQTKQAIKDVAEIAVISGADVNTAAEAVQAAAANFGLSGKALADLTVAAKNAFGTPEAETLKFFGQTAPSLSQYGVSPQQGAILAAGLTSQAPSRTGEVEAESFNRILPEITKARSELIGLQQQSGKKIFNVQDLVDGNYGQFFTDLLQNFDKLDKAEQLQFITAAGNGRTNKDLVALLNDRAKITQYLTGQIKFQGSADDELGAKQKDLKQQLAELRAEIDKVVLELLNSGLADFFKLLVQGLQLALKPIDDVFSAFASLPGPVQKALELVVLLGAAIKGLQIAKGIFGEIGSVVSGGGGGLVGAGIRGAGVGAAAKTASSGALARAEAAQVAAAEEGAALEAELAASKQALLALQGKKLQASTEDLAAIETEIELEAANNEAIIEKIAANKAAAEAAAVEAATVKTGAGGGFFSRFLGGSLLARGGAAGAAEGGLSATGVGALTIGAALLVTPIKNALHSLGGFGPDIPQTHGQNAGDVVNTILFPHGPLALVPGVGGFTQELGKILNPHLPIGLPSFLGGNEGDSKKAAEDRQKIIDQKNADLQNLVGTKDDQEVRDATDKYNKAVSDYANKKISKKKLDDTTAPLLATLRNKQEVINAENAGIDKVNQAVDDLASGKIKPEDFHKTILDEIAKQQPLAKTDKTAQDDILKLQKQNDSTLLGFYKQKFADTVTAFQDGDASTAEIQRVLKDNIAKIKSQVGPGLDRNREIADEKKATDKLLIAAAKNRADAQIAAAQSLATTSGASPRVVNQVTQVAALGALRDNPKLQQSDKENIAQQYVTAQQAVLQDLAAHAHSTAEAIAILKKGLPIPPEIQQILGVKTLKDFAPEGVTDAISVAAKAIGESDDAALNAIVEANQKGEDGIHNLILAVRTKIRKIIQAAARLGKAIDSKDFRDLLNAAEALDAYDQSGGTKNLPKTPTATFGDTSQYANPSSDTPQSQAEAQSALLRAQANGDPLKEAQASLHAAFVAKQFAKGVTENIQADAQILDAQNQINDAYSSIAQANLAAFAALVADDPIKSAQIQVQQAQQAYAQAKGDAARANAFAQGLNAQHQLRDAMIAGVDAQHSLMIAMANARGDTIGAAKIALDQAVEDYNLLIKGGVPAGSAKALDAFRNVVTQQSALKTATVTENEADIQFDLDLHKISAAQAIARLEGLKAKAAGDKHLMQDLARKIDALKHEAGQDLQFNLPSIVLPTFYEARRLAQQGAGGFTSSYIGSGQNFTDNRQINIVVNTSATATPKDIANAVAAEMNKPSTFGTSRGLY